MTEPKEIDLLRRKLHSFVDLVTYFYREPGAWPLSHAEQIGFIRRVLGEARSIANSDEYQQEAVLMAAETQRTDLTIENQKAPPDSLRSVVGLNGFRTTVKTKSEPYKAPDGKHYWNCWTSNYQPERDGYCQHAFCEEDRTGKTLCGVVSREGGGISIPNELDKPSCRKCMAIMLKRGALIG